MNIITQWLDLDNFTKWLIIDLRRPLMSKIIAEGICQRYDSGQHSLNDPKKELFRNRCRKKEIR